MNRAAVIPYAVGYCAVVIVGGDAPPFALLHVESIEAGALVEKRGALGGKVRDLSTDTIGALAFRIVALLSGANAARVMVEIPATVATVPQARASAIGAAVTEAARAAGLTVDTIDPAWRGQPGGSDARAVRAAFPGWPSTPATGDTEGTRCAAALALYGVSPEALALASQSAADAPMGAPSPGAELPAPPAPMGAPEPEALAAPMGAHEPEAPAEPAPPPPDPPVLGPRWMGVDPGSRKVGVVILEGDRAPYRVIHRDTLPVGRVEPLSRPIKRTRKDGTEKIQTERITLPWPDVVALSVACGELARRFGVLSAGVERVVNAYVNPTDGAGGAAIKATRLIRSAEVGAAVALVLGGLGVNVYRIPAALARAELAPKGKIKGEARAGLLGQAVAHDVPELATVGDEHQRDGGALAICVARLAWGIANGWPGEAPPRRHAGKHAPRVRHRSAEYAEKHRERNRKRAAEIGKVAAEAARAERAAAGCVCPRKHRRTCPLFVPSAARATA